MSTCSLDTVAALRKLKTTLLKFKVYGIERCSFLKSVRNYKKKYGIEQRPFFENFRLRRPLVQSNDRSSRKRFHVKT